LSKLLLQTSFLQNVIETIYILYSAHYIVFTDYHSRVAGSCSCQMDA